MPSDETARTTNAPASPSATGLAPEQEREGGEAPALSTPSTSKVAESEPILNFRRRPDEEEEEERREIPVPIARSKRDSEEQLYHWDIHLVRRHVTTNAGISGLTDSLQKFLDAVIRGMVSDHGTPLNHPVVGMYLNMYAMCDQIKGIFRPQQVQMTPEQMAELQRQARTRLS